MLTVYGFCDSRWLGHSLEAPHILPYPVVTMTTSCNVIFYDIRTNCGATKMNTYDLDSWTNTNVDPCFI